MLKENDPFVEIIPLSVEDCAKKLGLDVPTGICILPSNFFSADKVSELQYAASAQDIRVLFKKEGIAVGKLGPDGIKIPFHSQHDAQWIGPILFFTAAVLTHDPNVLSVALGVISNWVSDCFKGKIGNPQMTFGIAIEKSEVTEKEGKIEKTEKKETVLISFSGPVGSFKTDCEKSVQAVLKKLK